MADVIVIGSGPAGVSASLYTARGGLATRVISKGSGALGKTDKIQNYYGFPDLISGEELERNGIEGAKKVGVEFLDAEVLSLGYEEKLTVETTKGVFAADYVVLATGVQRKTAKIPGLRELEGKGVSYCAICDAFFYRQKPVAVLGSGEYALHEAEVLLPTSSSVTLLTDGAELTADFPEEITVIDKKIQKIEGTDCVESVSFEDGSQVRISGVFVAYGTEDNHVVTDEKMRTTVPGLYAAGDCNGGMLQIAKAVYEGAVAGTDIVKQARKQAGV